MPVWPGGACPQCGEDMPPSLIHCQTCRALLNSDLKADTVEIPAFVPLQEVRAMFDVEARGFYVDCPDCGRELRINKKYVGEKVACKFCTVPFLLDMSRQNLSSSYFYSVCPGCDNELRVSRKYMDHKVACKHCNAHLHFVRQLDTSP